MMELSFPGPFSGLPEIDSRRAFSVSQDWRECATRRFLLIIFKRISVQDNSSGWGTEGSEGRWVRQPVSGGLSFSITKSVALTKHPVDVTFPHIACGCRPMLQLHYRRRSDGWMADVRRACWCVCGGRDGQTCVRAGASPSSPRSSLSHHASPHAAATRIYL